MKIIKIIKDYLSQIWAISLKNIKLTMRFKLKFFFNFIGPILGVLMPLIVMGQLFTFNEAFGPWNADNFLVYPIIAYEIKMIYSISKSLPGQLMTEKFWKTLPALIIAPFKRISLLIGAFISQALVYFVPMATFLVICWFYYPISFFTILGVLVIFLLILSFFSGIGLFLSILAISKENFTGFVSLVMKVAIIFSCLTLPFTFFPEYIQVIINLNPLYYIFDIARLVWIENNPLYSLNAHPVHFMVLVPLSVLSPIVGLYIFNFIYDKYGIAGY